MFPFFFLTKCCCGGPVMNHECGYSLRRLLAEDDDGEGSRCRELGLDPKHPINDGGVGGDGFLLKGCDAA
jgi:hypothetical protein